LNGTSNVNVKKIFQGNKKIKILHVVQFFSVLNFKVENFRLKKIKEIDTHF